MINQLCRCSRNTHSRFAYAHTLAGAPPRRITGTVEQSAAPLRFPVNPWQRSTQSSLQLHLALPHRPIANCPTICSPLPPTLSAIASATTRTLPQETAGMTIFAQTCSVPAQHTTIAAQTPSVVDTLTGDGVPPPSITKAPFAPARLPPTAPPLSGPSSPSRLRTAAVASLAVTQMCNQRAGASPGSMKMGVLRRQTVRASSAACSAGRVPYCRMVVHLARASLARCK